MAWLSPIKKINPTCLESEKEMAKHCSGSG